MEKLSPLLQKLIDTDIDFVIVGGFAAVLYGSTYTTRDLDVCTVLTSDSIERLRDVLKDLNPVHRLSSPRLSFLETPKPGDTANNLYLQTDLGAIDVLGSIASIGTFQEVKKNAKTITLFGKKVSVISIEDLINSKQSLGREKDLLVVKELKAIMEKQKS